MMWMLVTLFAGVEFGVFRLMVWPSKPDFEPMAKGSSAYPENWVEIVLKNIADHPFTVRMGEDGIRQIYKGKGSAFFEVSSFDVVTCDVCVLSCEVGEGIGLGQIEDAGDFAEVECRVQRRGFARVGLLVVVSIVIAA